MRYRLLRKCSLERIGGVVFPLHLRKGNDARGWEMLAASNNYDVLYSLKGNLSPYGFFKIVNEEGK